MSRRWRGQIKFNAESHVTADAIENRGVDRIQQLQAERLVGHDIGVIEELDALGVAGIATADLFVRGLAGEASRVTHTSRRNALDALEVELRAPKAAPGESGNCVLVDGFGDLSGDRECARLPRERLLAPSVQDRVFDLLHRLIQAKRREC